MVKSHEIKRVEKLFDEKLKESKPRLNIKSEKKFTFPKVKREDNFKDKIEKNCKEEVFVEINKNSKLSLEGCGIVNIKVSKDCELLLEHSSKELSIIQVNLLVERGVKLSLYEFSNSSNLFKNLYIYEEENAKINFNQVVLKSSMNIVTSFLQREADYNLTSGYFANQTEIFMNCNVIHLEEKSESNMDVKGVANKSSRVICDGLVRIEKDAINSSGHQKLRGLLLDEQSVIISEPILEVENNKVQCSHGASISQVKDEVLFYMNSRGLPQEEIIKLIVQSFYSDFLEEYKEKIFCSISLT